MIVLQPEHRPAARIDLQPVALAALVDQALGLGGLKIVEPDPSIEGDSLLHHEVGVIAHDDVGVLPVEHKRMAAR